jgi:hypothetical protein
MLERETPLLWRRLAIVFMVALTALACPALAFAATGPWQSVDLTLVQSGSGTPVLLVAGRLPDSAALPAKVTLAVPPGGKIAWAGEVLGGDPSKDPSVKYKVQPGKTFDLVSFTLTNSRIGQVEVDSPSASALRGSATVSKFAWTAPYEIPTANLWIQMPRGATVTSGTPGGKAVTSGPSPLYSLTVKPVSKNQRVALTVAYRVGAAGVSPTQPATATQRASTSPVLIVGAVAFLLAITYFALKRFASEPETELDHGEPVNDSRGAAPEPDDDQDAFVIDEPRAAPSKPASSVRPQSPSAGRRPSKRGK